MTDSIEYLSPKQVRAKTSLSKMTLWRMVRRGEFPAPVDLTPGRKGYPAKQVNAWCASKMEAA